jgi:hypothetical protein
MFEGDYVKRCPPPLPDKTFKERAFLGIRPEQFPASTTTCRPLAKERLLRIWSDPLTLLHQLVVVRFQETPRTRPSE